MAVDDSYIALRCSACDTVIFHDCDLPVYDENLELSGNRNESSDVDITCASCGITHGVTILAMPFGYREVEYRGRDDIRVMLYMPPPLDLSDEFLMFFEELLADPYWVYRRSSHGLQALASYPFENDYLQQPQFRMIYANYIAVIEAYLCDRIIGLVTYNDYVLKKFLSQHRELGLQTVTIMAVLGNPKIVSQEVNKYLKNCLYHKLDLVGKLYFDAFEKQIFQNSDQKMQLRKAIELRHDIVHRNGRSKDGTITNIDSTMLIEMHALTGHIVRNTENLLEGQIRAKQFFEFENHVDSNYNDEEFSYVTFEEQVAAFSDVLPSQQV